MSATKIEWADATINPVVGCSKCSPGCDNCYAERRAAMLAKNPATYQKYQGTVDANGRWTGQINGIWMSNLPSPEDRKAKRIFIGSMGDMFHEKVSTDMLVKMFAIAAICTKHTFIFLTKRPERMLRFMSDTSTAANDSRGRVFRDMAEIYGVDSNTDGLGWPLPNVWLGVTVCNQAEADEKIPLLLQTPAAKRFVSVEPMLGPVDLTRLLLREDFCEKDALKGDLYVPGVCGESSRTIRGKKLDWVICGGETGPRARPMNYAWAYKLAEQCWSAGTPFFFKSWGEWTPAFYQPDGGYKVNPDADIPHGYEAAYHVFPENPGIRMYKVGKKRSGRSFDERGESNEVPA